MALTRVFDKHLTDADRVSLVKFGVEDYTQTVFSLVRKDLNLAQLRSQLTGLKKDCLRADKAKKTTSVTLYGRMFA